MKRLTGRIILLVGMAAAAPLLLYGLVSVSSLRAAMRESAIAANLAAAERAAEQIDLYVKTNVRILQSIAADLAGTDLSLTQQDRILKNHVIDFPEFREITHFDSRGVTLATSRVGRARVRPPASGQVFADEVHLSAITLDDDLLPTMTMAVRPAEQVTETRYVVGELSLIEMWRLVDRVRVGNEGFAMVATRDGRLIADRDKRRIARGVSIAAHPLLQNTGDGAPASTFTGARRTLAVKAAIPAYGWIVLVEQPEDEAFAVARELEWQLMIAIGLALLTTVTVGYLWGRNFIGRIALLIAGTRALAEGRLRERVTLQGEDELRQLGDSFNTMADRLVELQDNARKQERTAMFGRIAVGLVHDLSHPIQNISNSCGLILKMSDDPEYRQTFRRTVDREVALIKRMLEDLRNLARPIPLEHFPIDANRAIGEIVESMRSSADVCGVTLEASLDPETGFIEGDRFGLSRVLRNLILNAFQATLPGGGVSVSTERTDGHVRIAVRDTGCGIPAERLRAIFEDFETTKRRGLGLGLAISRKIVEQLDGRISVESEVGKGSRFVVEFPRIDPPAANPERPA